MIIPPFLNPNDNIGICCPAGYINPIFIDPCVHAFESEGYHVTLGSSVYLREFTMAGTDAERSIDMQMMIDNPNIKAILFGRGGFGSLRIIDNIDFSPLIKYPKWLIGFSDITAFHMHVQTNCNMASIHAGMMRSFSCNSEDEQLSLQSLLQVLKGNPINYRISAHHNNRPGSATGRLIGGNLKIIETLCGSVSMRNFDNRILFIEDVGEAMYSIDRMLIHLKRSGKLNHLAGLIVGSFSDVPPQNTAELYGKDVEDLVLEITKEFDYPICCGFPVGHTTHNLALICGMEYTLEVASYGSNLRIGNTV